MSYEGLSKGSSSSFPFAGLCGPSHGEGGATQTPLGVQNIYHLKDRTSRGPNEVSDLICAAAAATAAGGPSTGAQERLRHTGPPGWIQFL